MKTSSIVAVLLLSLVTFAASQEIGGVRYLGHFVPPSGGAYTAGCWGWTDTVSGREYAILGNYCGTAVVEITNVGAMVERDFVPGVCSSWREVGVHRNFAYVVSEGGGGTQIIDLSYLPDSVHLVKSFTYTFGTKNTSRAHTISVKDGYMNLNGCANWGVGGILIFDLADPVNPLYRGEYAGAYIHDSYMKNDTIFGAGIYGTGVVVINAKVKTSPVPLYAINYPGSGTHNTSTTVDGAYILSTDEIGSTPKTLKIWDRSTSTKVAEYTGSPTAIVHNVFVRDNLAIMSYYTAGMRVVDLSDPSNPVEVGGYDTFPVDDRSDYDGAWSVYPYFPSGKIIVGDMASGMYVVEVNVDAPFPPAPFSAYSDYTSPASIRLDWADPTEKADGSPLTNFKLHIYRGSTWIATVDSGVETYTDPGRVNHTLYTYSIRAVTASDSSSLASASAWAGGHPTPAAPASFKVSDSFEGNLLRWTNPSTQLDGTPLNDLAYVLIYRDGGLFDSLAQSSADTGQERSWTDTSRNYHTYYIAARDNEIPVHYSANTPAGSGFGGLFMTYDEPFDSGPVRYQVSGAWDTTSWISASAPHSLTDSPFGYYAPGSTGTMTTPRVVLGPDPVLRFDHIAIVAFGDFAWVQISTNNRASWTTLKVYNMNGHPLWTDSTADPGDWETQLFDLGAYEGDSVNIRFQLVTNGSVNADGWYIDNLYIGTSREPAEVGVTAAAGWNLISLPVLVPDASTGAVLPGALTPAYRYDNGYWTEDSLENGKGYWSKFTGGDPLTFSGLAIVRDTINVVTGWNLIGSITFPVAASTITTLPAGIIASQVYGYSGGYQDASALVPGHAYWLKTAQAGKIILSALLNEMPGAAAHAPAEENRPERAGTATTAGGTRETDPVPADGVLVFSDAAGNARALTLACRFPADAPPSWYELPPLPPAESFDVRFSSGHSLEVFGGGGPAKTIVMQGARFPSTVSWRLPEGGAGTLSAGEFSRAIAGSGSATLDADPGVIRVAYSPSGAEALPAEFGLDQNYPNPFNPSTSLSFRLAAPGLVKLEIFNTLGQRVATLADGPLQAGAHTSVWDTGASGDVPGGVYYARISVTGASGETLFRDSRKLLLMR